MGDPKVKGSGSVLLEYTTNGSGMKLNDAITKMNKKILEDAKKLSSVDCSSNVTGDYVTCAGTVNEKGGKLSVVQVTPTFNQDIDAANQYQITQIPSVLKKFTCIKSEYPSIAICTGEPIEQPTEAAKEASKANEKKAEKK